MPTHPAALRPHLSFRRPSRPSSRHRAPRASRPRVPGAVAVPLTLAFVYCLYAAFISGDNGWSTGLSWLIALVSAAVLFVLCFAIGRTQHRWQPEATGVAYAAVSGVALGYLLSLNDDWSVLRSVIISVLCAAGMGLSVYYITHTHRRNDRARAAAEAAGSARGTGRRPVRAGGRAEPAERRPVRS